MGISAPVNPIHYLLDTNFSGCFWWPSSSSVILSWLVQFGVINRSNPIVSQVGEFLHG